MTALPRPALTPEQIAAGLDDPGDPFGLACMTDASLRYFAPMRDGQMYRHELTRRARAIAKAAAKAVATNAKPAEAGSL